jgi:hypothetical protein
MFKLVQSCCIPCSDSFCPGVPTLCSQLNRLLQTLFLTVKDHENGGGLFSSSDVLEVLPWTVCLGIPATGLLLCKMLNLFEYYLVSLTRQQIVSLSFFLPFTKRITNHLSGYLIYLLVQMSCIKTLLSSLHFLKTTKWKTMTVLCNAYLSNKCFSHTVHSWRST